MHVLGEERAGECSGAEQGTATGEGPPGKGHQESPGVTRNHQEPPGHAREAPASRGSRESGISAGSSARESILVLSPGLCPGSFTRGSIPVCVPRARSQFFCQGSVPVFSPGLAPGSTWFQLPGLSRGMSCSVSQSLSQGFFLIPLTLPVLPVAQAHGSSHYGSAPFLPAVEQSPPRASLKIHCTALKHME